MQHALLFQFALGQHQHKLIQCIAVNITSVLTVSNVGAGNVLLLVAHDASHLTDMLFSARCSFVSYTSRQEVTGNYCDIHNLFAVRLID